MLLLVRKSVAVVALVAMVLAIRWETRAVAPTSIRPPAPPAHADTAVERGRLVYARYGCAMCHGADGKTGTSNPNSETDGKVPAVVFVKEGYTPKEVANKVLDGFATIGRQNGQGPTPPLRMPGWRGQMTQAEADDLTQFLISLYPASASESWR
jgi:mono/diheme cytochrome c family protein